MRCVGVKRLLPLLAVAVVFTQTDFAASQWLSRWNRPAVSSGDLPSEAGNSGSISYPGGTSFPTGTGPVAMPGSPTFPALPPGAVLQGQPMGQSVYGPGQGGYPYSSSSSLPAAQTVPTTGGLMRSPVPAYTPGADSYFTSTNGNPSTAPTKPAQPAPVPPAESPNAAHVRVHVPSDAKIWAFDHLTTQKGEWRNFVTPPLEDGKGLTYELRAHWTEKGKDVEQTRKVKLYPGDRLTVDFFASDSGQ